MLVNCEVRDTSNVQSSSSLSRYIRVCRYTCPSRIWLGEMWNSALCRSKPSPVPIALMKLSFSASTGRRTDQSEVTRPLHIFSMKCLNNLVSIWITKIVCEPSIQYARQNRVQNNVYFAVWAKSDLTFETGGKLWKHQSLLLVLKVKIRNYLKILLV